MPVICWGQLAKSADDTQKIEQSIQDYVENHNENENAHQVYGSSLYMHRFEALLDHKFGSVDLKHLIDKKLVAMSIFESSDGWSVVGTFDVHIFEAYLATTAVIDNASYIFLETTEGVVTLDYSKNPFFQTSLFFGGDTSQVAYFGIGQSFGVVAADFFGFKVVNGTLYAITRVSEVEYLTEITGITITDLNVYRAYVDSTAGKVYFYVNGVLVHTESTHVPAAEGDYLFTYYIKTTTNASRRILLCDFLFEQDR